MNIVITDLLANKLMQKSLSIAQKICYIISLKDMLYIYKYRFIFYKYTECQMSMI